MLSVLGVMIDDDLTLKKTIKTVLASHAFGSNKFFFAWFDGFATNKKGQMRCILSLLYHYLKITKCFTESAFWVGDLMVFWVCYGFDLE